MNVETSLKLYELTQEFIKNKNKAKEFVTKLEQTVEDKFSSNTQLFSTKEDISNLRAELIKWMFVFWIGQILALLAIVNFMLK